MAKTPMASITFCKSGGDGGEPQTPKPPLRTSPRCPRGAHLPLADALDALAEGSLQPRAELEGVAADLDDVVDQGAHGGQREGRGEEHHVAELDEHLLVVLEGVLRGGNRGVGEVGKSSEVVESELGPIRPLGAPQASLRMFWGEGNGIRARLWVGFGVCWWVFVESQVGKEFHLVFGREGASPEGWDSGMWLSGAPIWPAEVKF